MAKTTTRTRSSSKLSQTTVNALKPGAKVMRYWDSTVSGFHVRVTPGSRGKKVYCVTFQRSNGQKVNVTIGECSSWKFVKAKERAQELRKLHEEGKDPRAHVLSERSADNLKALVKEWEEKYKPKLKPSSRVSYASIIKTVILPELGTRIVKDLTHADVEAMHAKESKKHETNANRAVAVLSRLLSIAEKLMWRPKYSNPCKGLEKNTEKPRSRVFKAEELFRLETNMMGLVANGKLDPSAADLVRFLAFSGLRTGEAKNLRWKDVDIEGNKMIFKEHKTSKKKGTKELPLNSHLREILERRKTGNKSPYVWPSLKLEEAEPKEPKDPKQPKVEGPLVGLAKMWARICEVEESELLDVTPHDLRRTFMTVCTELGNSTAVGDTLLGHSLGRIKDTYVNLRPEGVLAIASQGTADWIAAALKGEKPKLGYKIKAKRKTAK